MNVSGPVNAPAGLRVRALEYQRTLDAAVPMGRPDEIRRHANQAGIGRRDGRSPGEVKHAKTGVRSWLPLGLRRGPLEDANDAVAPRSNNPRRARHAASRGPWPRASSRCRRGRPHAPRSPCCSGPRSIPRTRLRAAASGGRNDVFGGPSRHDLQSQSQHVRRVPAVQIRKGTGVARRHVPNDVEVIAVRGIRAGRGSPLHGSQA